jgi:peroxiredoxin
MDPLIAIGEQAPLFQLPDLKGKLHSLEDLKDWMVVLNFWSAECVWCERVDYELSTLLDAWKDQVKVLWIASNANEPRDLIERVAIERNLPTILLDTQQEVADRYGAQTTPHFFVVDGGGKLAYQGAWDDITFRQRVATKVYLPTVIDSIRRHQLPEITQTPPYGCMIVRFPEKTN